MSDKWTRFGDVPERVEKIMAEVDAKGFENVGVPITNVDYVCPACSMTLKAPVLRSETVTWVEGKTRHYAHAACADTQIIRKRMGG